MGLRATRYYHRIGELLARHTEHEINAIVAIFSKTVVKRSNYPGFVLLLLSLGSGKIKRFKYALQPLRIKPYFCILCAMVVQI
jgi:hypothetical protein